MPKRNVPKDYDPLKDLNDRISQFIEVNNLSLERGDLTPDEAVGLEAQNRAFLAVKQLIRMIEKKGSIWKGGYLDNVGVVYSDQVQEIIDTQKALNQADELDQELMNRVEREA